MRVIKKTVLLFSAAGALAVFAFSLWGSSCQTLRGAFRGPLVSLRSVDITGVSLQGVDLLCTLELENPNSVDLPFPEIGWDLFINTGSFLSGTVENREPLKARGLTAVNIPVSLGYGDLLNALRSFREQADADYSISLEVRFLLPVLGERVWNFDYQGKIPLVRMIAFRNPSLKIENLDFSGADVVCSLDIENPNPFPLPFPAIDYSYAVRNSGFITGRAEFPGSLAAGKRTPAEIRLRAVFSDLYRSFSSLENAGEAAGLFSLTSLVSLPGYETEKISLEVPGSLPLLRAPVLSFRGISIKNISLSRIDLESGWDLDNPNSFSFDVDNLEYSLLVNGTVWAQGTLAERISAAPGRKAAIPLAVSISSPALVKELTDIITRGADAAYELKGTAAYSSAALGAFSGSSLPFSLSGRTKLRR
jgi:LEA14-like dessication related protein